MPAQLIFHTGSIVWDNDLLGALIKIGCRGSKWNTFVVRRRTVNQLNE